MSTLAKWKEYSKNQLEKEVSMNTQNLSILDNNIYFIQTVGDKNWGSILWKYSPADKMLTKLFESIELYDYAISDENNLIMLTTSSNNTSSTHERNLLYVIDLKGTIINTISLSELIDITSYRNNNIYLDRWSKDGNTILLGIGQMAIEFYVSFDLDTNETKRFESSEYYTK